MTRYLTQILRFHAPFFHIPGCIHFYLCLIAAGQTAKNPVFPLPVFAAHAALAANPFSKHLHDPYGLLAAFLF
jgi:hypothetical protein